MNTPDTITPAPTADQFAAYVKDKPVEALGQWFTLKAQLAQIQERERAMRATLFGHFFPQPVEGTNNFTLPDGHVLKGKYPIDRKVDAAVVQTLRTLKLGDLEPAMLAHLNINPAAYPQGPATLVTEALRLNVDELLKWEPALVLKEYRKLTAEQVAIFDRCLTIKPGSASMEVADPPKRAAAPAAAGFNGPEAA